MCQTKDRNINSNQMQAKLLKFMIPVKEMTPKNLYPAVGAITC